MSRTIKVSNETKERLDRFQGMLLMNTGIRITLDGVINLLLNEFPEQEIDKKSIQIKR
jgi:hypothetical protein